MTPDLPPAPLQALVADAVHHAASKLFQPSVIHVAPINTIGCFLLQHLFRREYRPVTGSIRIRSGGTPFGIEARIEDIDAHEYYLWLEAPHAEGRVELVDFASRYWPDWAKGLGQLWVGPPPPPAVWTWKSELAPDFAEYELHDNITAHVQRAVGEAIARRAPDSPVDAWEKAINDAIDYIAQTDQGLAFLVESGLAEPLEDDPGIS